jgi:hypothetical protein
MDKDVCQSSSTVTDKYREPGSDQVLLLPSLFGLPPPPFKQTHSHTTTI